MDLLTSLTFWSYDDAKDGLNDYGQRLWRWVKEQLE